MKEYSYPLKSGWSTEEITTVIRLWNAVESAYESSVNKEDFLEAYRGFKQVVPMKSEERQLSKEFEEVSGYSLYRTLRRVQSSPDRCQVKMVKGEKA